VKKSQPAHGKRERKEHDRGIREVGKFHSQNNFLGKSPRESQQSERSGGKSGNQDSRPYKGNGREKRGGEVWENRLLWIRKAKCFGGVLGKKR